LDVNEFASPGKSYRPSPFWSWNDALDVGELRWQVREFAEKGFGGYFMHSRVGLATPYLSSEWMKCIRACLKEGIKVGTESWLYDEDKWPSGFAGGLVPAKNERYRTRSVRMEELTARQVSKALRDRSVLGVFEVRFLLPIRLREFRRIRKLRDIKGKGSILAFKVEVGSRSNWYNGESYVDLLNPEVTKEFLRVTVDAYAKKFKKDFGEFMPGIFTDEPNYVGRNLIPWTEEMADYFRKVNGYDILDKLPLLYFEGEGFQKVRYDFWKTVTKRFIEAFSRPYGERCVAYGLSLTGHYLCEDNFHDQIRHVGAAMPHYEYMQVLGIDHLGRNINDPLTLKQCSSIGHQFGRSRVLSELFGCSGHSMTFEDQKWIADFHLALGITFFCPHLTLYTMKGDAKRDFPPTLSYHQPYWQHFKLINDYFARGSYLCSQGRFQANILVLHSIGSAWATFTPALMDRNTRWWKYNDQLVKLQDDLLSLHRDFDFGDEVILSRHGRVEENEIIIRESRYKVVIVPPSVTWSAETVKLLKRFLVNGGKIIFVGETPGFIDGEHAGARWLEILNNSSAIRVDADREAIAKVLDAILPRSISVSDEENVEIEDILVHHRAEGANHIYFLANKSRTKEYDAIIVFSEKGEVTEWNMLNGSVAPVDAVTRQGRTLIRAAFNPAESHAFVLDTSKPPAPEEQLPKKEFEEETVKLPEEWSFKRLHPNSIVLDACEYSFGRGKWNEKTPIWKIRREAWRRAGLEKYTGIQPWVLMEMKVKPKPLKIRIRASFKSEAGGKQIFLVVEKSPIWKLVVNGKRVSTKVTEWHWDKQFGKINISNYVRPGENIVDLSCNFGMDVTLEDMYLVGDFGVKKVAETEYVLTDEPAVLRDGDWAVQGYPFYSGTMQYRTTFSLRERQLGERVLIRLPEAKGTLFLVNINGKGLVPICWQPLEADVTDLVQTGENELSIDVVSSLRNTFGPLHHKSGDPYWVGPFTFTDEASWVDAYQLVPYGLIKGAEVVIRREKAKVQPQEPSASQ